MTTSNLMSLPIDIPWKRLGTSKDMMDDKPDRSYPIKWRSSLSIFYHEPPPEEQKFDDRTVTYIKVSCTITGFQKLIKELVGPDGYKIIKEMPEVGVSPEGLSEPWKLEDWHNFYKSVSPYFPCYGAMLQVAVFPRGEFVLEKYPFIVDFEPKKREMYESAIEAKEMMSQSRSGISVKKGTTTTKSTEHTAGAFLEASLQATETLGLTGGGSYGYKRVSATEDVDITTADYSREKRENYSYTTNISHMYHLMKGYHLGTNRALFLVLPRPHIMDSEYTFVNGPRRLEGIQEFFLVIERPKEVPGFCVEATLETAHLQANTVWVPEIVPVSSLYKNKDYQKTDKALGIKDHDKGPIAKQLEQMVHGWWTGKSGFALYDSGHKEDDKRVCLRRGWNDLALDERAKLIEGHKKGDYSSVFDKETGDIWYFKPNTVDDNTKKNKGSWIKENRGHLMGLADWVLGYNEDVGTQNAEVIYYRGYERTGTLFLTGRTTTNCLGDASIHEGKGHVECITYERKINIPKAMDELDGSNAARAAAANIVSEEIGYEMLESLSSLDRLPFGEVDITELDFIQEPIRKALRDKMPENDPYNVPLEEMEDIDPKLRAKLAEVFAVKTRKEALDIELYQLRSGLDLTEAEARHLRRHLIGKGPALEGQLGRVLVPNLEGLSLEEAHALLARVQLTASDELAYQDALDPNGTVLNQFPNAGTAVNKGEVVSLVVSNGPVVIPDVIGLNLDDATSRLEELSLRVAITSALSDQQPEGHVLETTPSANTEVVRNSQVVLLVARSAQTRGKETRVQNENKG